MYKVSKNVVIPFVIISDINNSSEKNLILAFKS